MGIDVTELIRRAAGSSIEAIPGDEASEDLTHDEALGIDAVVPACVAYPRSTSEVAAVLAACDEAGVPVTARGSGTGLSGAAIPSPDGVLLCFEHMAEIVDIDTENLVAVVQPGVTLSQLDGAVEPLGLVYPVFPGEYSASLGGNVATNAGGMHAVKYGVTRHQVLGLEAVLASGDVIRTGGRYVKGSTGYDLTQLIVGSEGTLAVVTEAILRLHPRLTEVGTVLAPFATLDEVSAAVPPLVASGVGPRVLEYIDVVTMSAMVDQLDVQLGVPDEVKQSALAYLVVQVEQTNRDRLDEDVADVAARLADLGALDAYVLPATAATQLIHAREKAFWLAKGAGADDIVDVVVPRASIPKFLAGVTELAVEHESWVAGCGHAGDGNVHLSVFQHDAERRHALMSALFSLGLELGGAISGEHGLGRAKKKYFTALADPAELALMHRIKAAFDPNGVLNPGAVLDE